MRDAPLWPAFIGRFALTLLDSGLQMRWPGANEAALTLTKHLKIGEHEQGR